MSRWSELRGNSGLLVNSSVFLSEKEKREGGKKERRGGKREGKRREEERKEGRRKGGEGGRERKLKSERSKKSGLAGLKVQRSTREANDCPSIRHTLSL